MRLLQLGNFLIPINYWAEMDAWEHFKFLYMQPCLALSPAVFQLRECLADVNSSGLGRVLQWHLSEQEFGDCCVTVQVQRGLVAPQSYQFFLR